MCGVTMTESAIAQHWEAYVGAVLAASGSVLTIDEAARLMKLDPRQVQQMITNDRLLAVSYKGELRIPMAQLVLKSEPDRLEVVDGIPEIIALTAICERPRQVEALRFLANRDPALNTTPFEALRNRRTARVVSLAMARLELDQLEAEAQEIVARLEANPDPDEPSKAYVFGKAVLVFGSSKAAVEWLRRPALALNGARPLDLLESAEGLARLRTLLIQLDYSVYI